MLIAAVAKLMGTTGKLRLPHVSIVQQDNIQAPARCHALYVVLTHTELVQVCVVAPHARAGQPRRQAAQRCHSA